MSYFEELKKKQAEAKEQAKKTEIEEKPKDPMLLTPKQVSQLVSAPEIIPVQTLIKEETKEIGKTLYDSFNKSAKLNYLKFSYALLTGKSTSNKTKKSMKQAIQEELKKL